MLSHLQHISDLTEICFLKGIKHVVISPGSRNNPLIRSFASNKNFLLHSIVDERSAAFYGLGLSLSTGQPVALICTSGTAVLNYSPGLAEAYYQHIPLIAITADRPEELIDQQDNQTIRQKEVFRNFVKGSISLNQPSELQTENEEQNSSIDQVINLALSGIKGPVHINVPVREPLNLPIPESSNPIIITHPESRECIIPDEFIECLDKSEKRMILCGQDIPDSKLNEFISLFAKNGRVVIISEPISNISSDKVYSHPDRIFAGTEIKDDPEYLPEMLISFGGHIISKNLKKWLLLHKEIKHWRVSVEDDGIDTYNNLKGRVLCKPSELFTNLPRPDLKYDENYINKWKALNEQRKQRHTEILTDIPWSDLFAFRIIMENLPQGCVLHLGNSSPVRYAQLFDTNMCKGIYCNRGVSGIDGSLSTAAGFASVSEEINILITGDLSFVYDSNGLWNRNLSQNLRIIVINNQGGGIFRLISEDTEEEYFKNYVETKNNVNIQKIAEAYGIDYYFCDNKSNLKKTFLSFLNPGKGISLLEIRTPKLKNAEVYHEYFKKLKL
ncbi:MAG: 2-succinyl-5-enolpyruvyl-6-hydroxy-3-cyclohexene-1-carboxylic-acid synthase [Prolixibacteraceae bacterium]|nr:2-succinyl-5-enolpyruvyl-6-hydroxy-3-cyclohexene-1-carboxylic-acid synthase [Prolixibacteraceae bacterium]